MTKHHNHCKRLVKNYGDFGSRKRLSFEVMREKFWFAGPQTVPVKPPPSEIIETCAKNIGHIS